MIAQVIVDVAAKQTDRVFEYHIPKELTDVAIGSRVVVPFGLDTYTVYVPFEF